MKKIYVVTAGCYSDYGIVAVFDDEALAEQLVQGVGEATGMTVETFDLNPGADALRQNLLPFLVQMKRDGSEATGKVGSPDEPSFDLTDLEAYVKSRGDNYGDDVRGKCWARDEAHAIKIVNEKRLMALSSLGAGELK